MYFVISEILTAQRENNIEKLQKIKDYFETDKEKLVDTYNRVKNVKSKYGERKDLRGITLSELENTLEFLDTLIESK